ncbi:hypothetical protein LCGC14_2442480 [marine sediment metagenome]|uniref:Uncharacterized protein n=1 Tax=marine sediment metagenome TaxID=412755 RepID=A0A0F9ECL3_9ZZZZ
MLEAVRVAEDIMKAINAIKVEGKQSYALLEAKAMAMANYDKELAVAMARLKGEGMPVSVIEKTAKGSVSDALCKKILCEEILRAHYCRLENLRAQLNGLQSVNRFLEYTVKNA